MEIRETKLLSSKKCEEIIEMIKKDNLDTFVLRTLGNHEPLANGYILPRNESLGNEILKKVAKFTNSPIENLENVLLMQYGVENQAYKPHFDYIEELQGINIEPGHRIKTCIIYLNDDFEGGETDFPLVNVRIKPEVGKAIYWFNAKEDDLSQLDENSRHSGLPVKKGIKNILVVWVRENKVDHLNLKYRFFKINKHINFLTDEECDKLISKYSNIMKELPIINPKNYKGKAPLRTIPASFLLPNGEIQRTQMILKDNNSIIKKIKNKFSELTETPLENQEPVLLIKYEKDQGYKEHLDNFPNFDIHKCRRTHSLIIYLNECEGGETYFRYVNEKIKPKKGLGIIWDNLRNGEVLPDTAHSSLPVLSGTKYILVLWVRETKYGGPV